MQDLCSGFFLQKFNDCIKVVYIHVSNTTAVVGLVQLLNDDHAVKNVVPNFYDFVHNKRNSEDFTCNCNACLKSTMK